MLSKTTLISAVITALWAFFGGYLLWGVLTADYFESHVLVQDLTRAEPDFIHLSLGCLFIGIAFSVIYSKWANRIYSIGSGVIFGLWIGILTGFGEGLVDYSTSNFLDISATLVNGLLYIIFYVIMGMLASLIYSKWTK
ncbi:hypothetical protein SAMN03097699_3115 [Flavobacteriaceae bacterium MAR_2010_188]|nr:hypothetical protein SAMN03097699_3115 [Flavobacteriaceae bacterium MAR_2010_188]